MGKFIEAERGVKLYVHDLGAGKPIVMLHGWPLNHQMFEYQSSWLPAHGFRCVMIDLRGFGHSDKPWSGYGYDRLADDIRAVVDTLQLNHFTLLGFSVGGAIAIRYISRHGGHGVNRLGLLAAAAPSFTQREGFPYGKTRAEVDAILSSLYRDHPQTVAAFGENFFASQVSAPLRSWFQSLSLTPSLRATAAVLMSLRDEDLRGDLGRVRVPTGIFHGALDQICPFPLAEAMHRGIQGSTLHRFERSGHGIFYDELDLFNRRLLAFLNGLP